MNDKELKYRIAFSLIRGNNRIIAEELLSRIGSEEDFFNTPSRIIEMRLGKKSKSPMRAIENNYSKKLKQK